jgi:hypothetical protein
MYIHTAQHCPLCMVNKACVASKMKVITDGNIIFKVHDPSCAHILIVEKESLSFAFFYRSSYHVGIIM